jgi:hypothetical protein
MTNNTTSVVRDFLMTIRHAMRRTEMNTALYDLMLEHGREYKAQSLPERYHMGSPGNCFADAWRLMTDNPDLTYVEGWASAGILPVEHAWCVDKTGRVIDPTWAAVRDDDIEDRAYWGIPFRRRWVLDTTLEREYFGVFHPGPPDFRPRIIGAAVEDWLDDD